MDYKFTVVINHSYIFCIWSISVCQSKFYSNEDSFLHWMHYFNPHPTAIFSLLQKDFDSVCVYVCVYVCVCVCVCVRYVIFRPHYQAFFQVVVSSLFLPRITIDFFFFLIWSLLLICHLIRGDFKGFFGTYSNDYSEPRFIEIYFRCSLFVFIWN